MLPKFITFTGVDEKTDLSELVRLSNKYSIEWGVLFSPKNQGNERYIPYEKLNDLCYLDVQLSAHLCGGHSRTVMENKLPNLNLAPFGRIQVNSTKYDDKAIRDFADFTKRDIIRQARGTEFPDDVGFQFFNNVRYLYDCSGGRGVSPSSWPSYEGPCLVGFAGGIGPDNVLDVISNIKAPNYWIDMESKIRTDGWLDLNKCREVCEKVYG